MLTVSYKNNNPTLYIMILTVFLSQIASRVISNSQVSVIRTKQHQQTALRSVGSVECHNQPGDPGLPLVLWVSNKISWAWYVPSSSDSSSQSSSAVSPGMDREFRERERESGANRGEGGGLVGGQFSYQGWWSARPGRGEGKRGNLKPTYGAVVGSQGAELLSCLLHALTLTLPVLNTLVRVWTDKQLRRNTDHHQRSHYQRREKMKC